MKRHELHIPGIDTINIINTNLDQSVDIMELVHKHYEKELEDRSPSANCGLLHFACHDPYIYPKKQLRKEMITKWQESAYTNNLGLITLTKLSTSDKILDYEGFCKMWENQEEIPIPTSKIELEKLWSKMTHKSMPSKVDLLLKDEDSRVSLYQLDNPLQLLAKKFHLQSVGILTTFMLLGAPGTGSSTHKDDRSLASMCKLKEGLALWIAVDKQDNEKLCKKLSEILGINCHHLLNTKNFIIPPALMDTWGIRYYATLQQPGDVIVTMPGCIYTVFNITFTIKEACYIIPCRWINEILDHEDCFCNPPAKLHQDPGSSIRRLVHGQSYNQMLKNSMILDSIVDWRKKRQLDGKSILPLLDPSNFEDSKMLAKLRKLEARRFKNVKLYNEANKGMTEQFVCQVCIDDGITKSNFESSDSLWTHISAFHVQTEDTHTCETCNEPFGSWTDYVRHRSIFHTQKLNIFS